MKNLPVLIIAGVLTGVGTPTVAQDNWFVRPYIGLSQMSDVGGDFSNIDGLAGNAAIDLDMGFTGGMGIGYRYNDHFAIEAGWEYRSNDSTTVLDGTSTFDEGNYASSLLYVNGHYLLAKNGKWQPYVGGGLTWAQEVDIDLERGGNELSYSGDGDTGYQLFAGINYDWNQQWRLQGEVRYGSITGIDLKGEGSAVGQFDSIDYETTTLQFGLVYNF